MSRPPRKSLAVMSGLLLETDGLVGVDGLLAADCGRPADTQREAATDPVPPAMLADQSPESSRPGPNMFTRCDSSGLNVGRKVLRRLTMNSLKLLQSSLSKALREVGRPAFTRVMPCTYLSAAMRASESAGRPGSSASTRASSSSRSKYLSRSRGSRW